MRKVRSIPPRLKRCFAPNARDVDGLEAPSTLKKPLLARGRSGCTSGGCVGGGDRIDRRCVARKSRCVGSRTVGERGCWAVASGVHAAGPLAFGRACVAGVACGVAAGRFARAILVSPLRCVRCTAPGLSAGGWRSGALGGAAFCGGWMRLHRGHVPALCASPRGRAGGGAAGRSARHHLL